MIKNSRTRTFNLHFYQTDNLLQKIDINFLVSKIIVKSINCNQCKSVATSPQLEKQSGEQLNTVSLLKPTSCCFINS